MAEEKKIKPSIFISHIHEEASLALELKKLIEQYFTNHIDVFVSSDYKSLGLGEDFVNKIKDSLEKSDILISLCSPISVKRQWINIEAGAAWISETPIIPICHSGLNFDELPLILKLKHGLAIDSKDAIVNLFDRITDITKEVYFPIQEELILESTIEIEKQIASTKIFKDTKFVYGYLHQLIYAIKFIIIENCTEHGYSKNSEVYKGNPIPIYYNFLYKFLKSKKIEYINAGRRKQDVLDYLINEISSKIEFILLYDKIELAPKLKTIFQFYISFVSDLSFVYIYKQHSNYALLQDIDNYFGSLPKYKISNLHDEEMKEFHVELYKNIFTYFTIIMDFVNEYEKEIENIISHNMPVKK